MNQTFGPVLGFRGQHNGHWRVSVLTLLGNHVSTRLRYRIGRTEHTPTTARRLKTLQGTALFRFDLALPQSHEPQQVHYTVAGQTHAFQVPALGEPLRLAYASCNGFSSRKAFEQVREPNERWTHLARRHRRRPYHLLLMGGDQIYADSVFEAVKTLRDWQDLPRSKKRRAAFPPGVRVQVEAHYYHEVYLRRWGQPEVAQVLAGIPTLMILNSAVGGPAKKGMVRVTRWG